ncbi:MAG: alpha-amylase [Sandaracinaceae bacterium]|nr:alpha-amylase [Sandaracinaceae bacterium]
MTKTNTTTSRVASVASVLGAAALSITVGSCAQDDLGTLGRVTLSPHVDDWRDEIIYQLLTDRFANGDAATDYRVAPSALARYQGGDWQGIIDHLDYLEDLGITSIWISPIVLNVDHDAGFDAYHGYWAVDLERLNPHFGDLATLRAFVREAHARGMSVILDIVTNHLGQVFYYDINNNGQPDDSLIGGGVRSPLTRITEYDPDYDPRGIQAFTSLGESGPAPVRFFDMPEIFRVPPNPPLFQDPSVYHRRGRVTSYDVREQVLFGDFPGGLKDLATEDPRVRDEMVRVYTDWILTTDIDGFRIDTLKHVDDGFWLDFAPRIRQNLAAHGKTNFFMFGEAFDGDDELIGSYTQPGMLDSVFYFSHKFWVFSDVFQNEGPTTQISRLYAQRDTNYSSIPQEGGIGARPRDVLVNFMDNHDVPRFLYDRPDAGGPDALRSALAYLLTEDGIPCIYYGTEQDYAGGNDPANREPLWWSGYATDGVTFQWIARLTRIRRGYAALTHGSFDVVWATDHVADESDAGVVAFERRIDTGDYALVVINTQGRHASRTSADGNTMTTSQAAGTTLVDILSGERFTVGAGGSLEVEVGTVVVDDDPATPPRVRILVPESQVVAGL